MERLTTDKPVSEMGMLELAHNSCYVGEDGSARYRDFDTDIDARELARKLMVDFNIWIPDMIEMTNDEKFDWVMLEELSNADVSEKMFADGLIPLFYRNLWAMADLRERLKHYEDAEEQGLLVKLPCAVGTELYKIINNTDACAECGHYSDFYGMDSMCDKSDITEIPRYADKPLCEKQYLEILTFVASFDFICSNMKNFGKTIFLTKEEAEAALAKMESEV